MDLKLAIQCAEAIDAMYRGDLAPTIVGEKTDTQVRVEEVHRGEALIVFPGTESLRDFRTDAKILKTDWDGDGAKAHRGFVEAFRDVGERIVRELDDRGAQSIIITGHSLGGALATLCGDVLADRGMEVRAVFTFGSPRVGNRTFASRYDDELIDVTHRIVNACDPVPWFPLPLPSPRTGIYTHVSGLTYLQSNGDGMEDDFLLLHPFDLFTTVIVEGLSRRWFKDILTAREHRMVAYLEKLKGISA